MSLTWKRGTLSLVHIICLRKCKIGYTSVSFSELGVETTQWMLMITGYLRKTILLSYSVIHALDIELDIVHRIIIRWIEVTDAFI